MKKNIKVTDYSLVEESLNSQIKQVLTGLSVVPEVSEKKYQHVIIAGMGGSRLPAEIITSVFSDKITVPVILVSDYSVSKSLLSKDVLVIALSYSGNTEEVVSLAKLAINCDCDLFTISAGGELAKIKAVSNLVFPVDNNPSLQPRYGVGYMFGTLLGLMQSLKIIDVTLKEIKNSIYQADKNSGQLKKQIIKLNNTLKNKVPIFVGAEHLSGLVSLMQNQIHETAKNFAGYFIVPNLNHHLLEGLAGPKAVVSKLHFIVFSSKLYWDRNILRTKLTEKIIKKQGVGCDLITVNGEDKLTQALTLLAVCGLMSLNLAKNNRVDPTVVPWVDYFKKSLK